MVGSAFVDTTVEGGIDHGDDAPGAEMGRGGDGAGAAEQCGREYEGVLPAQDGEVVKYFSRSLFPPFFSSNRM